MKVSDFSHGETRRESLPDSTALRASGADSFRAGSRFLLKPMRPKIPGFLVLPPQPREGEDTGPEVQTPQGLLPGDAVVCLLVPF